MSNFDKMSAAAKSSAAHSLRSLTEKGTVYKPHIYYKTGEPDAPEQIKDRNNEVVLQLCRVCGQAEGDLTATCPGRNPIKSEVLERGPGFIRGRMSMERHPDDVSTHGGQQVPKNEWFARVQKYTETVEKIHNPNSDILHEAWSAEGGAYLRLADLKQLVDACRRAAIRAERPSKREEDLEEALDLALRMLVKYEPGDSRAVSDEYVAMAALISGIEPNELGGEVQIIRAARERMIKESNNV